MKNKPLAALSSAAIVAVYAAGYVRTRAAAERFDTPPPQRTPLAPRVDAERAPVPAAGRLEIPPASVPTIAPRAAVSLRAVSPTAVSPTAVSPTAVSPREVSPREAATARAPVTIAGPPPDATAPGELSDQAVQGLAQPDTDTPPPVARGQYKDGSYTGWGYCRHGDIQASVVVDGGQIVSAKVAQCLTRYSCNWIEPLYPQVMQRQNAEVDYISGASESSDAFHDAVAEALAKAK